MRTRDGSPPPISPTWSYFRSLEPEARKLRAGLREVELAGLGTLVPETTLAPPRSAQSSSAQSGWEAVSHGPVLAPVASSPSATRSGAERLSADEDLGQRWALWRPGSPCFRGNPLSCSCSLSPSVGRLGCPHLQVWRSRSGGSWSFRVANLPGDSWPSD